MVLLIHLSKVYESLHSKATPAFKIELNTILAGNGGYTPFKAQLSSIFCLVRRVSFDGDS